MTCPKCRGEMHSYERNGVTVEQCSDCRGLFLDRGELERLTAAETRWYGDAAPAAPAAPAQPYQQPYPPRRYDDDDDRRREGYGHGRKRRKESFLDDLFG